IVRSPILLRTRCPSRCPPFFASEHPRDHLHGLGPELLRQVVIPVELTAAMPRDLEVMQSKRRPVGWPNESSNAGTVPRPSFRSHHYRHLRSLVSPVHAESTEHRGTHVRTRLSRRPHHCLEVVPAVWPGDPRSVERSTAVQAGDLAHG